MKIVIPLLVLTLLLSGCDQLPKIQPTITDQDMQTKVARILTAYPTSTGMVALETPVVESSQEVDVQVSASPEVSQEVTETPTGGQEGIFTNTPPISVPTQAPTETPQPTIEPTATVFLGEPTSTMPATDPALKQGTPTWFDSMDKADNWPLGNNEFTAIDFKDGFMQYSGLKKDNGWRLSVNEIENFYMEMTARPTECKGTDRYGLMIRVPDRKEANRGYWFQLSCDGKYAFQKWDGTEDPGKVTGLIGWTANSAINAGSNQTNRLGIMAIGDTFTLYVNGVKLATVEDNSWLKGGFGVVIGAKETTSFTVYVDQMRYWLNPAQ